MRNRRRGRRLKNGNQGEPVSHTRTRMPKCVLPACYQETASCDSSIEGCDNDMRHVYYHSLDRGVDLVHEGEARHEADGAREQEEHPAADTRHSYVHRYIEREIREREREENPCD